MSTDLHQQIEAIVTRMVLGSPSAAKRGRNAQWPYIAVIKDYLGRPGATHNPMGRRAYATRDEAIAAASQYIEASRAKLRHDLGQPRMRALREQYGLPREL